ncbi:MAG: biosynthetic arginine decarboxylase [Verrucomicrobiales bacterium]|jgi:arginine decarboxylase|nr:biosynthetic arginine decarboxylase [Verrucomicrobiales bacterium]
MTQRRTPDTARKPSSPSKKAETGQEETPWSIEDASETYGINHWGAGYYAISRRGEVSVDLTDRATGSPHAVSIPKLLDELDARGIRPPLLLRFPRILERRIEELYHGFAKAISDLEYSGMYRGVFPIKVNQQQQVAEEVAAYGRRFHYGFEVGSKPELIAALAYLKDTEALLVCNGYKDEEFIDLALYGQLMGLRVVLVLEMPHELDIIEKRSAALGVEPVIGVRVKLSAEGAGKWAKSGGEKSPFGLNLAQLVETVERLRTRGRLEWLQMLHCHQGSQIPDLTIIRRAIEETARIYAGLVKEGAPMGLLNLGGGLAVDYDGSRSTRSSSANYSIEEYCHSLVDAVKWVLDESGVEHPTLVTESGRSMVAHYSMLALEILDVNRFENRDELSVKEGDNETIVALAEVAGGITADNLLESYGKANRYREELHENFLTGDISLRERAVCEQCFWRAMTDIAMETQKLRYVPEELRDLSGLLADQYYGNFSIFQSLADSWAIDCAFPVMPLHRLGERPTRRGVIHDVTCDCDGMIKKYVTNSEVTESLPVHETRENESYFLGIFLVGAYQETLSDLHNLFGDTHAVSVDVENGKIRFSREVEGDSVADVLEYVEHDPKKLVEQFRELAETAITDGLITAGQRKKALEAYRNGMSGYTYFES